MTKNRFISACKAGLYHFLFSTLIALIVAWVVFFIWYPSPYRELIGGLHLFLILVTVDVVCGPLLMMVIFNPKKSKNELILDISVIVIIQAAALLYGIYSIYQARPVALIFEVDRFVVVSAVKINQEDIANARDEYKELSIFGKPWLLSTRKPQNGEEMLASIESSSRGVEPSVRPNWWQSYDDSRDMVKIRMKPLEALYSKGPEEKFIIKKSMIFYGFDQEKAYYLPLVSGENLDSWSVILDENAKILGFLPIDGFSE